MCITIWIEEFSEGFIFLGYCLPCLFSIYFFTLTILFCLLYRIWNVISERNSVLFYFFSFVCLWLQTTIKSQWVHTAKHTWSRKDALPECWKRDRFRPAWCWERCGLIGKPHKVGSKLFLGSVETRWKIQCQLC